MLSPAPMTRFSAVILEKDALAALRGLGELGAVELICAEAGPDTAPLPPPDTTAAVARCRRFLARTAELRKALDLPAPAGPPGSPVSITLSAAEENLTVWEGLAGGLLTRRRELIERLDGLTAIVEQVSGYQEADISPDQAAGSPYLRFVIGSLPAGNMQALAECLPGDVVLAPMPERNGRCPVIIMASPGSGPGLDNMLNETGFQPATLPVFSGGTLSGLYENNRREMETVSAEIERLNRAIQARADEAAGQLEAMETAAGAELGLFEAQGYLPRTAAAALLTGWVPEEDAAGIEENLNKLTGGRCAFSTVPPGNREEEDVPVLLRPPRPLRFFVPMVEAYGLPRYRELEPTVFAAVSWLLMFGVMFGDAGQGAVIALAGGVAARSGRPEGTRRLGSILLYAGLSGMFFGIVYGSFFGLPAFRKYALWRDPLEGDMTVLMLAAIKVGVAMISLGVILNIINRFRHGDALGGFLDKFGAAGLVFYWGALYVFACYAGLQAQGLLKWVVPAFILLPMACWAMKEPVKYCLDRRAGRAGDQGGLTGVAAQSLVEAFEAAFLYLANTISFVRLAAYAASHAALLMAAFMMAAEVKRLCGGSSLAGALIIILGNAAAIVLEGTVAAVQALRLEYYEFFGKFFTGGGRAFKPFSLISGTD